MIKELSQFIKELVTYLGFRIRQISLFAYAGIEVFVGIFSDLKSAIISRMFWGRGSFYRTSFHLFISIFALVILLSGISSKLNIFGESVSGLGLNEATLGNNDFFAQSGTSESLVLVEESQYDYDIYKHIVEPGNTLESIAKMYGKNVKTIVWSNGLANEKVKLTVGQVLRIPNIDGAFYKVQKNDTLDKIATKTKSDKLDIIDFNSNLLDADNPVIKEGMELFIPEGIIPDAPVVVKTASKPVPIKSTTAGTGTTYNISKGTFINPLINCPGYSYIRGFKSSHKGVDLAKRGGCWMGAAAPGKVIKIGYDKRGGNYVWLDHGNGFQTRYYHGLNQYAVSVGDQVQAGQNLLYMGCTGSACTGTHLHFEMHLNGKHVNPESYVCLKSLGCSY